jgi:hypothetical protein
MRRSLLTAGLALLCATLVEATESTCFKKAVPWNGLRTIKLSVGDWAACDINMQM